MIIHKFELEVGSADIQQTIKMPLNAIVLATENQNETLQVWAAVHEDMPMVDKTFYVVPTGGEYPKNARYIGLTQFRQGKYVFHVFEEETIN